jgi:hypothetical protein
MSEIIPGLENDDLHDIPFKHFLDNMKKQMNFVGILSIIFGAISCLSIIGAITGVPQILSGIKLRESADQLSYFIESDDKSQLKTALKLMSKYYEYTKLYFIINLVLIGLIIVFYIAFFAFFGTMLIQEFNANV